MGKRNIGRRIWLLATLTVIALTFFVIGRNFLHAVSIRSQIRQLERERTEYLEQIEKDSMLIERMKYDDYLEEYARERYDMQRPGERVYIIE